MKIKYLALFLSMFYLNLKAQDKIDPNPLQIIDTANAIRYNGTPYFVRSWNWGSTGLPLDSALLMNASHQFVLDSTNTNNGFNTKVTQQIDNMIHARNINLPFNGISLFLSPNIIPDSTSNFKPTSANKNGAVFGFKYRELSHADTSNNQFKLSSSGVTTPFKVLDSIWDGTIIHYLDYDGDDHNLGYNIGRTNSINYNSPGDIDTFHVFNGKQFYLTINLKALDKDSLQLHLNDTIFKIKLRFNLVNIDSNTSWSGYVKFDKTPELPRFLTDDIYSSMSEFRGYCRRLKDVSSIQPTEFIITGSMLKTKIDVAEDTNSITLSAFANFTGKKTGASYDNNPRFKPDWWENRYQVKDFITRIDPEVWYCGKLDTKIEYIKLETPRAQNIFRGMYDADVDTALRVLYNQFRNSPIKPKLKQIYLEDEFLPSHWYANRYLNMLCDTLGTTETYLTDNPYNQCLHATSIKNFISGSGIDMDRYTPMPFIRKGYFRSDSSKSYFNYGFGYKGTSGITDTFDWRIPSDYDSLNSQYETYNYQARPWGSGKSVSLPLTDTNIFTYTYENSENYCNIRSSLFDIEQCIYSAYYKSKPILYSEKSWIQNLWVESESWGYDSTFSSIVGPERRPKTGEENRFQTNLPLILGTKGFSYWFKTPFQSLPGRISTGLQNQHYNGSLQGYELIYSDVISGDWMDFKDTTLYKWGKKGSSNDPFFKVNHYNWDTLGIDFNHIYLGFKSIRAEIRKLHNFIIDNESTLLKLNLQSWYGKGYLTFNTHSPSVADTFMTSIVNVDSIKTKKLFQPLQTGGFETQIQGESRDSSFFDVTILKYDNFLTDWVFYLGVQNRRTDPLLWDNGGGSWRLNFIPTAKFDSLVAKGGALNGTSYSASEWQDLWWKRLGCREISIPMKINNKDGSGNEKYALLRVTEMTTSHPELNYFNSSITNAEVDKLYPKVDKVIGQDGSIVANYLPGEMKIFKVQVLPPAELTGKLDNINQNKMVSMPVYSSGTMTNEVVYYTTYYENHVQRGVNIARLAVSRPIDKNSNYSDIVWISSSTISDTLIVSNGSGTTTINPTYSGTFYNSYHPTIAVRKDPANPDLHSVFILYSVKRPSPIIFTDSLITIAETKYTYNPSSMIMTKNYNHEINSVRFLLKDSLVDLGTPTINSSKDVLFYAWSGRSSDALRLGIFYTVKKPNETGIGAVHSISDSLFPDWSSNSTMLHPSLNTYSNTITFNGYSNHATLVWDQDSCTNGQLPDRRLIYMTNLFYDNPSNVFGHYLKKLNSNSDFKDGVYFYNDSNIVKFNWGGSAGIYPSVYSEISNQNWTTNKDYLAFERRWSDVSRIFLMTIIRQNSEWDVKQPMFTIMTRNREDHSYNTLQPVVKQPSSIIDPSVPPLFSQSKILLNFKLQDSFNGVNDIYQFNMIDGLAIGTLSLIDSNYQVYSDNASIYRINKIASDANQNHLAASPIMNYDPTAWKNRRIFETGTNTLLTSARYFYKQNQDGLEIQNYFGYTTDTTSFYIGDINRDNTQLKMRLPYSVVIDTLYGNTIEYDNRDSIYSDWFTVNSTSTIDFKLGGRNPLNSNIFIQRRDSNSIHNVPVLLMGDDSLAVLINLMLINGNGKDYRLVIVKTDTLDIYQEQIVLGGKPILDTLYFKSNKSNVTLIDLNGRATISGGNELILNVTPNPAENEAYAIAYIPNEHLMGRLSGENKLLLSLYNSIGMLIKEVNCVSGETVKFDLRELGNGNYFVKVREKADTYYEVCKPAQKSLLIKR